jgi:fatty-acyl-CoA synthase
MQHTTIDEVLRAWSIRQPQSLAVRSGSDSLSWSALIDAMDSAAAGLIAAGVLPGERVATMGPMSLDWSVVALGAIRAGAILCPLNERYASAELSEVFETITPRVVVIDPVHEVVVRQAVATSGVIDGADVRLLRDLSDGTTSEVQLPATGRSGSDPVAIMSTSGSTGQPKAVVYTHESMFGAFFEWALQAPELMGGRTLNVSPMSFAAGLLNGFLGPLVLGGETVLLPLWDPQVALDLIVDAEITCIAATTIFYEQMARLERFADVDLSSLGVAFIGGNPVTADLMRAWTDKGVGLRQAYGLTESSSNVTFASVDLATRKPESVGLGGILTRVEIIDADGEPSAAGEPGEIWISGPGVATGYWQDEGLTAETFGGGWLRTGDVGVKDHEGAITIVGRTKDMIKSGGMNIYAAEVERAVLELPSVLEAAVIGVADTEFGEAPALLVRTSAPMAEATVIDHCRSRLATYKAPRYVVFLDEPLPRTPSMKIDKRSIRNRYADIPDRYDRAGRSTAATTQQGTSR